MDGVCSGSGRRLWLTCAFLWGDVLDTLLEWPVAGASSVRVVFAIPHGVHGHSLATFRRTHRPLAPGSARRCVCVSMQRMRVSTHAVGACILLTYRSRHMYDMYVLQ